MAQTFLAGEQVGAAKLNKATQVTTWNQNTPVFNGSQTNTLVTFNIASAGYTSPPDILGIIAITGPSSWSSFGTIGLQVVALYATSVQVRVTTAATPPSGQFIGVRLATKAL